MVRQFTSTVIIISLLSLTACGGRTANPVMVSQYGDEGKSCRAIEFEMSTVQGEIQRLLPDTDKTGKNVALGVAGWFLLVPWFFMDFKNGEQQEYEAYRQRYNHLASLAIDKKCGVKKASYPSVEEMKKSYEEQQKKKEQQDGKNN
jgi:hypothetical protein